MVDGAGDGTGPVAAQGGEAGAGTADGESREGPPARPHPLWTVMSALVGIDFLLGIGSILAVPYGRPTAWVPVKGAGIYLAHGVLGALVGLGAIYLAARSRSSNERILRLGARAGLAGVALAGVGGLLAVSHPLRLVGMAIMLLGSLAAVIGYGMPGLEAHDRKERAKLAEQFSGGGGGAR